VLEANTGHGNSLKTHSYFRGVLGLFFYALLKNVGKFLGKFSQNQNIKIRTKEEGHMYNGFNQYQMYNPYQPQARSEVIRVTGENGARMYQMPPNSSALLLDESEPIVWLKQTDGAGYPTITPYKITPFTPESPVKGLEERITRLEEIINAKSNSIHDAESNA